MSKIIWRTLCSENYMTNITRLGKWFVIDCNELLASTGTRLLTSDLAGDVYIIVYINSLVSFPNCFSAGNNGTGLWNWTTIGCKIVPYAILYNGEWEMFIEIRLRIGKPFISIIILNEYYTPILDHSSNNTPDMQTRLRQVPTRAYPSTSLCLNIDRPWYTPVPRLRFIGHDIMGGPCFAAQWFFNCQQLKRDHVFAYRLLSSKNGAGECVLHLLFGRGR